MAASTWTPTGTAATCSFSRMSDRLRPRIAWAGGGQRSTMSRTACTKPGSTGPSVPHSPSSSSGCGAPPCEPSSTGWPPSNSSPARLTVAHDRLEELLRRRLASLVEEPVKRGQRRIGHCRAVRRRKQAIRTLGVAVEAEEERRVRALRVLQHEQRVDDGIERQVVLRRRLREQARVAEEHVIQLVHDEQVEVFVGAAPLADEVGVDPQDRAALARNGGRRDVAGHFHAQERQQRVHRVAPRRHGIEHPVNEDLVVGHRVTPVRLFEVRNHEHAALEHDQ